MKGVYQLQIKTEFTVQELGVIEKSERDFKISLFKIYRAKETKQSIREGQDVIIVIFEVYPYLKMKC